MSTNETSHLPEPRIPLMKTWGKPKRRRKLDPPIDEIIEALINRKPKPSEVII